RTRPRTRSSQRWSRTEAVTGAGARPLPGALADGSPGTLSRSRPLCMFPDTTNGPSLGPTHPSPAATPRLRKGGDIDDSTERACTMSTRTTRVAAVLAGLALALTSAACTAERTPENEPEPQTADGQTEPAEGEEEGGGGLVGIAMPTRSLERWNNDGSHLEALLQERGYETSLQYADNEVDQQITQLQNMINQGAEILVIASIDGTALGPVLEQAASAGTTVIAYDRLINGTENVDYYATFDNYEVGRLQGQFIVDELGLEDGEEGPFNLEPFAGSPDDNNALFFFSGAWDVLKPYIDSGQIAVPSGKAPESNDQWTSIGIQGWSSQTAQAEMENRLNSFYANDEVDVVLSPNDSLALGIEQALDAAGYT